MFKPDPVKVFNVFMPERIGCFIQLHTSDLASLDSFSVAATRFIIGDAEEDNQPDVVYKSFEGYLENKELLRNEVVTFFLDNNINENNSFIVAWDDKLVRDSLIWLGEDYFNFFGININKFEYSSIVRLVSYYKKYFNVTIEDTSFEGLVKYFGITRKGAYGILDMYDKMHLNVGNVLHGYRQAAMMNAGAFPPDENTEVVMIPHSIVNGMVTGFETWALKNGWTSMPPDRWVFVDPNGIRWSYCFGEPAILIKLTEV